MTDETGFPQAQVIDQSLTPESAVDYMKSIRGEMQGMGAEVGFSIQTGTKHKHSEDVAYVYANDGGETFIAVFDGIGGHGNGQAAAEIAQEQLHKKTALGRNRDHNVNVSGLIVDTFEDTVEELQKQDLGNAGTTGLVGVLQTDEEGRRYIRGGAVGDSLGYLVKKDGSIVQLNKEETLAQVMIDDGNDPDLAEKKGNVLTNGLLPYDYDGIKAFEEEVHEGDVIVFTSDGITGDRSDQRLSGGDSNEEVISLVALDKTLNPKERAEKLILLATKNDDRTAVVVDVLAEYNAQHKNVSETIIPPQPQVSETPAWMISNGGVFPVAGEATVERIEQLKTLSGQPDIVNSGPDWFEVEPSEL